MSVAVPHSLQSKLQIATFAAMLGVICMKKSDTIAATVCKLAFATFAVLARAYDSRAQRDTFIKDASALSSILYLTSSDPFLFYAGTGLASFAHHLILPRF